MDPLAELINQIRTGNVVLWAGSGFSKYTGYPDGKQLAEIIKKNVQDTDREYFEDEQQLTDVAQEFTEIYGSEHLIRILKSVFNEEPTSLQYHQMIAQIPQITHIVTTNYDLLFERAYGDKICSIVKDQDILKPVIRDKVVVYKIHGSLEFPDTIVITQDDYRDFYDNQDSLIWTKIKSLISEYTILFLGYAFEDLYVQYIFGSVFKKLGNAPKEIFWISPGLPQHKLAHYSKDYPIRYIDATAEEVVPKIKEAVRKNLIIDLGKGYIHPAIVSQVLEDEGFIAEFRTGPEGTHIRSIGAKDPENRDVKIEGKLSLESRHGGDKEIQKLYDLISGRRLDEIQIASEGCSIVLKASAGGIDIPIPDGTKDAHLTITRQPVREFTSSIMLKWSEKCIWNVKAEVHASRYAVQVVLSHPGFKMTLEQSGVTKKNGRIRITFEEPEDILLRKEVFGFFDDWIKGDEMLISSDLKDILISIPFSRVNLSEDMIGYIKLNSYIYSTLFKIQRNYGILFDVKDIEALTDLDLETIQEILTAIENKRRKIDSITGKVQTSKYDTFHQRIPPNSTIRVTTLEILRCKLLNHDLELGYGVIEGQNMYISNEDEIRAQLENGEGKIKVTFKSKTGDLYLRYCKDEGTAPSLPE
jgi:hypothetical protein